MNSHTLKKIYNLHFKTVHNTKLSFFTTKLSITIKKTTCAVLLIWQQPRNTNNLTTND